MIVVFFYSFKTPKNYSLHFSFVGSGSRVNPFEQTNPTPTLIYIFNDGKNDFDIELFIKN